MLSQRKSVAEQIILPFAMVLKSVHPNVLSVIGSIPPLLFFVFVVNGYLFPAVLIMPFFVIDLLDGAVARMSGRATAFGEFLDSTLDRVSDFLVISAFGFAGPVRFEIVIVFLFSAFMVSYTRSRGELAGNKKYSFNVGIMERSERLIGIAVGLVAFLLAPDFAYQGFSLLELVFMILAILSVITFFQRVFYAFKKL
jgi:CDP-diacylglycerol--glycerol-3-phosphate 3-phosphatidyltransferase